MASDDTCPACGFHALAHDDHECIAALQQRVAALEAALRQARDGLEAPLLFHGAEPWGDAKVKRWERLTGRGEATTRALCDFVRQVLFAADTALAADGGEGSDV